MVFMTGEIIRIVYAPGTLRNNKKLTTNLVAYSQIEFLEGYLTGMFGELIRNVLDCIEDDDCCNEALQKLRKSFNSREGKHKNKQAAASMLFCIEIVLLHNVNKKLKRYNLE